MTGKNNEPEPPKWEQEDLQELLWLEKSMDGTVQLLKEATREGTLEYWEYWGPHVPQLLHAIDRFRRHCRDEIERFDQWREDGRDTDEVVDMLDDERQRLSDWLTRMILPRTHPVQGK